MVAQLLALQGCLAARESDAALRDRLDAVVGLDASIGDAQSAAPDDVDAAATSADDAWADVGGDDADDGADAAAGPDAGADATAADSAEHDADATGADVGVANDADADANDAIASCPPSCDDGVACTVDDCDAAKGVCVHVPNHTACDDGNVCTSDVCAGASGCVHNGISGSCGGGKVCDQGQCATIQGGYVITGGFAAAGATQGGGYQLRDGGFIVQRTCGATHCLQGGFRP